MDDQMQVFARLDPAKKFRLLELTPDLETSLRNGSLSIKSTDSEPGHVYLCTDRTTYFVRRLKQSNSLLFCEKKTDTLDVFASPFELLETQKTQGTVDWSQFPLYNGHRKYSAHSSEASEGKPAEWNCSQAEFDTLSRDAPTAVLDSTLHVIAANVVYDIIVDIVSAMVEQEDLELSSNLKDLDLQIKEPEEVVSAVYNKFAVSNKIDLQRLSTWVGKHLLESHTTEILKSDFIKEWNLSLPIKLNTDLNLLRGSLIEPRAGWIQFFDSRVLPSDPRRRFDDLFAIKQEWEFSEIEPFIASLVPASQKAENWILKYAHRRRTGSRTLVSPIRRR